MIMSISNSLPTSYQQFIHKSRYARWLDEEGRRENWYELVTRNMQMHIKKFPNLEPEIKKAYQQRKLARNCREIRFVYGKSTFRKTRLQAL